MQVRIDNLKQKIGLEPLLSESRQYNEEKF